MVTGAVIYKAVSDHKEEIDTFVNEYGEFIEDDVIEPELLEEK